MIFRNWVLQNFPFLEDDFDALTDYELFCKMVEYMKKSLEKIKDFQQEINVFSSKLDEFQHWFDDLDVTEEVNAKLDEMVEDGTMEELIAQYLQLQTTYTYNNIEEMKEAENLVNGAFCRTSGYYTYNDGGGSYYKVRTALNTDTPNDEDIIALSDPSLVAEIIIEDKTINAKQFGAKGDGESDDTEVLQDVIDYGINNGYKIYLDKSEYKIDDTLEIKGNNISFTCDGTIRALSDDVTYIELQGNYNNIYIKSLRNRVIGEGTTGIGINILGEFSINNVFIDNIIDLEKGISIVPTTGGVYYNKFNSNFIRADYDIYMDANGGFINSNYFDLGALSGGTAIYSEAITDTGEYNANYFSNMGFEHLTGACVDLSNADVNEFKNFRLMENVTGSKFFKLDTCKKNKFTSTSIGALVQETKIQDNVSTRANGNIFEMNITKYGDTRSRYARKVLSYNGKYEVLENGNLPNGVYWTDTDYTLTGANLNFITDLLFNNAGGDVNIYLDDRFNYDNLYTKNLFIRNENPSASRVFKIYKPDGTQLLDFKTQYLDTGLCEAGKPVCFKLELSILNDETKVFRIVRVLQP